MRNDSADAVGPQFDEPQLDTDKLLATADTLTAIGSGRFDESEATGAMQPNHMPSVSNAVEGDWGPEAAVVPVDDDNPHWDDEGETLALDFHRLAPWAATGAVESLPDLGSAEAKWETAETDKLEPYTAGPLAAFALETRTRSRATESGAYQVRSSSHAPSARRAPQRIPSLPGSRTSSDVHEILRGPDALPVLERPQPLAAATGAFPRRSPVLPPPTALRDSWTAGEPTRSVSPARARAGAPAPQSAPTPNVRPLPSPLPSAVSTRKLRPIKSTLRAPAPPLGRSEPRPVTMPPPARASYAPERAYDAQFVPAPFPGTAARTGGYRVPPRSAPPRASGPTLGAMPVRSSIATGPFAPMPRPMVTPPQPFTADLSDLEATFQSKRAPAWLWLALITATVFAVVLVLRIWLAPPSAQPTAGTPAAAPNPAETGFSITTRPAGAQVFVDGNPAELITPALVRNLTPGLHTIDLKLPGYYDTSLPATLEQGKTLELDEIELRPLVAATEPAVAVAVPGAAETPPASARMKRAARRAARREREAARAAASENDSAEEASAVVAEEPPAAIAEATGEGVLKINSRPWAHISIDDQFRGNTPQRALSLSAGTHVVRLVNEPMKMSKTFKVEIRAGETVTRIETLNEDATDGAADPTVAARSTTEE